MGQKGKRDQNNILKHPGLNLSINPKEAIGPSKQTNKQHLKIVELGWNANNSVTQLGKSGGDLHMLLEDYY